jgi:hypothetical protein
MRLETAVTLLVSAAVIVGPTLWPRGVVLKSSRPFLNGTLDEYERVSGLKALAAWWKGELEREPGR